MAANVFWNRNVKMYRSLEDSNKGPLILPMFPGMELASVSFLGKDSETSLADASCDLATSVEETLWWRAFLFGLDVLKEQSLQISAHEAHQGEEGNKHNGKYLTIKTSSCLCGPGFDHITLWKWTAGRKSGFLTIYRANKPVKVYL